MIGQTIWKFDDDHREYARDQVSGRAIGGPLFEPKFRPHLVIGQTKQSWEVVPWPQDKPFPQNTEIEAIRARYPHMISKVRKHDLCTDYRANRSPVRWYTDQGKAEQLWKHEHKNKIVEFVRDHATIEQLFKVAAVVGIGVTDMPLDRAVSLGFLAPSRDV